MSATVSPSRRHPLQPERIDLGNGGHATGASIGCKPYAVRGVTADLRDAGGNVDELEESGLTALPLFAFFILIVAGLYLGDMNVKRAMIFVGVWGAARAGFGFFDLSPYFCVAVETLRSGRLISFGQDERSAALRCGSVLLLRPSNVFQS